MEAYKCVEIICDTHEEFKAVLDEFPDHLFTWRFCQGTESKRIITAPTNLYEKIEKLCKKFGGRDD